MEKIYTAKDKASDEGIAGGTQERMKRFGWNGRADKKLSVVYARVDFGAWIADCPTCGGAEYVDPEFPFFFCDGCKNIISPLGAAVPVVFPANRQQIESELLQRKIILRGGRGQVAIARQAFPAVLGASRSWVPGETVEMLREQHVALSDVQKGRKQ